MAKLAMVLTIATLLLPIHGCGSTEASMNEKQGSVIHPVAVATKVAIVGNVFAHYESTATLEALSEAPAVAKVGGEIKSILIEEGDVVTTGQVLAKLDARELQLTVAQAQANVKKLEQEYRRNKKLSDHKLISDGDMDRTKFELAALRSQLKLARLRLSYSQIRAPISGVVAARHIKVGNTLTTGDIAFDITDNSQLQAKIHVPQDELSRLKAEQEASLFFDALPNQQFRGAVERVSPTIDTQTGTVRITVAVDDPKNELRPGMFGRFHIIYDQHNGAVLIPTAALIREDQQTRVYVVEDGVAHVRDVETGYVNQDHVEIVKGVNVGELVVTVGQLGLKNGVRVSEQKFELATYTF